MERIRLDEEPILKIGRSLVTASGFESLLLRVNSIVMVKGYFDLLAHLVERLFWVQKVLRSTPKGSI